MSDHIKLPTDLDIALLSEDPELLARDAELMLKDYCLVSARIFYHLPDYPTLLQELFLQKLDIAPRYLVIRRYLDWWEDHIDGMLHSVEIASTRLVTKDDLRVVGSEFSIH